MTDRGRAAREDLELATDAQMAPALVALGDDFDDLIALLTEMSGQVMAGAGYPPSPLAISPSQR